MVEKARSQVRPARARAREGLREGKSEKACASARACVHVRGGKGERPPMHECECASMHAREREREREKVYAWLGHVTVLC